MANMNFTSNENIFEYITRNGVICFADTCFLMNPVFLNEFYESMKTYNRMHQYPFRLQIIPSVMAELRKVARGNDNMAAYRACKALDIIERDCGKSLVNYDVVSDTRHSDAYIIGVVSLERVKRPVCVFTQDADLQHDVFAMRNFKSCKGHSMFVMCFNGKREICSKYIYEAPEFKSKRYKGRGKEMVA